MHAREDQVHRPFLSQVQGGACKVAQWWHCKSSRTLPHEPAALTSRSKHKGGGRVSIAVPRVRLETCTGKIWNDLRENVRKDQPFALVC